MRRFKEHRAEIKKQEKKAKKADASDGKNFQQRLIVVGLAVLFLVLILLFIAKIRQYIEEDWRDVEEDTGEDRASRN